MSSKLKVNRNDAFRKEWSELGGDGYWIPTEGIAAVAMRAGMPIGFFPIHAVSKKHMREIESVMTDLVLKSRELKRCGK